MKINEKILSKNAPELNSKCSTYLIDSVDENEAVQFKPNLPQDCSALVYSVESNELKLNTKINASMNIATTHETELTEKMIQEVAGISKNEIDVTLQSKGNIELHVPHYDSVLSDSENRSEIDDDEEEKADNNDPKVSN